MTQADTKTFSGYFREVWGKLFPGSEWPETERFALTYMANEICMLRGILEATRAPGRPMQLREKIEWAHDAFVTVLADDKLESLIDQELGDRFMHYTDALCWVLEHNHQDGENSVQRSLRAVEMMFAVSGQGLIHTGKGKPQ